jgi:hypothetical protein
MTGELTEAELDEILAASGRELLDYVRAAPTGNVLAKIRLAATVALKGRLNSGSLWDEGYQAFARHILSILDGEKERPRHPEYPTENAGAPPGTIQEP